MRLVVLVVITSAGCGRIAFAPIDPVDEEVPVDARVAVPAADAPPGSLWLVPVADTYCRSGTEAGTNFGTEPRLVVKVVARPNFDRESFVKYDLASVAQPVVQARLVIGIALDVSEGRMTVDVSEAVDGWSEGSVTWNARPAAPGAVLATTSPPSGAQMLELDITNATRAALAGDRVLSLRLRSVVDVGDDGYMELFARESTNPPTLQLTF